MFTGKVHNNNFRNFLVHSVYYISCEEIFSSHILYEYAVINVKCLPSVSVDTSGDSSVDNISGLAVNYQKKKNDYKAS